LIQLADERALATAKELLRIGEEISPLDPWLRREMENYFSTLKRVVGRQGFARGVREFILEWKRGWHSRQLRAFSHHRQAMLEGYGKRLVDIQRVVFRKVLDEQMEVAPQVVGDRRPTD